MVKINESIDDDDGIEKGSRKAADHIRREFRALCDRHGFVGTCGLVNEKNTGHFMMVLDTKWTVFETFIDDKEGDEWGRCVLNATDIARQIEKNPQLVFEKYKKTFCAMESLAIICERAREKIGQCQAGLDPEKLAKVVESLERLEEDGLGNG